MAASGLSTGWGGAGVFRRFRFWVSLCLIGVLFWFLIGALERQADRAERVAVGVVLNQVRSALVIKAAEIRVTGDSRYQDWTGTNPMALLKSAPSAYRGLCNGNSPEPGQWCFAVQTFEGGIGGESGILIYQPDQPIVLETQKGSRDSALKWTVTTEFTDRNGNGRLDDDDLTTGLKLEPLIKRNEVKSQEPPGGR